MSAAIAMSALSVGAVVQIAVGSAVRSRFGRRRAPRPTVR
jgi:hypothetical protein